MNNRISMSRQRNHCKSYLFGFIIAIFSKTLAVPTIKLSSGYQIPIVGLGSWQINPEDVDNVVTAALGNGYTHIDTAFVYENEEAIGQSLKKWFDKGGKRENLFITTKLPFFGNKASDVEPYLKLSLERLGLQYVDLYLIHVPFGTIKDENKFSSAVYKDGSLVIDQNTDHIAIWKEMETQVKAGRIKSIGISNFNETQILNIISNAEIQPSSLQIELHAYNQQRSLRELCTKYNIRVTGYSTLGSSGSNSSVRTKNKFPPLLKNPIVEKIAQKHKKSSAQVLLRHAVQGDVIVIPKSTHFERIKANIDIFDFELTEDDMKELNDLDKGEDGRLINFLSFKGLEKHPQYPFTSQLKNKFKKIEYLNLY